MLPAACSLSNHQQTARRHASGQTPFTERLRQRLFVGKPPGADDPYGGEGVISKAWKKRQAEARGEQPEEAVQEEVVEEVDEAAAAAEAARVGSGQQKYDEASGFKPAKTAEGLPVIGHRETWQNFGARESDRYNP